MLTSWFYSISYINSHTSYHNLILNDSVRHTTPSHTGLEQAAHRSRPRQGDGERKCAALRSINLASQGFSSPYSQTDHTPLPTSATG